MIGKVSKKSETEKILIRSPFLLAVKFPVSQIFGSLIKSIDYIVSLVGLRFRRADWSYREAKRS